MKWLTMQPQQKIAVIKEAVEKGVPYTILADTLGTSPAALGGFARRNGFKSLQTTASSQSRKPRYKRGTLGINNNPRQINTPYKPSTIEIHGGAFSALPGSKPVYLFERTGCCWPVGDLFCNMNCHAGDYCQAHGSLRRST